MNVLRICATAVVLWTAALSAPQQSISEPVSGGADTLAFQSTSVNADDPSRMQPSENPASSPKKLWIFDRKTLAMGSTLAFSIPIVALEYQWWWRADYEHHPHKFRYE
ncbi:MAG: hypothetical protein ACM3Q4_09230, partial [Acidobacteriota bacterium]